MNTDDLLDLVAARDMARSGIARAIRVGADVSQGEVAAICVVTVSAVSRWERGERAPRGEAGARYGALLRELVARD
jgi:DNA-binding transcriptional regulator YiaG